MVVLIVGKAVIIDRDFDVSTIGASDISPIQNFGVSIQFMPTHTLNRN